MLTQFMDRHKQQIKRDRQDLKRREINSQNKSRMRTLIKSDLSEKDANKSKNLYPIIIFVFNVFDSCFFAKIFTENSKISILRVVTAFSLQRLSLFWW